MIYLDKMQKPLITVQGNHGPGNFLGEKILGCLSLPAFYGRIGTRTGTNLKWNPSTYQMSLIFIKILARSTSVMMDNPAAKIFRTWQKKSKKTQPFLSLTNLPNEKQKRTLSASPFFW